MDLEDLQCAICNRMYTSQGAQVPRLLPENGLTYCTACVAELLASSEGQDTFLAPEDDETPVQRKAAAEEYPKNFTIIKMAARYKK